MKLSEYLAQAPRGTARKLAAALEVNPVMLSIWSSERTERAVPVRRCAAIERATGGKVTRRDLRPDDWREHWPELAPASKRRAKVAA